MKQRKEVNNNSIFQNNDLVIEFAIESVEKRCGKMPLSISV